MGLRARSLLSVAAALGVVFLVSWLVLLTKPAGAVMPTWWPAAGIAVGMASRLPRRQAWAFSAAVGVIVLVAELSVRQSLTITLAAAVGVALETAIAAMILRSKKDRSPRLYTRADLRRLILAALLGATAFDLVLVTSQLFAGDPATALALLASAGPRHAASIMLIAPLFVRLPGDEKLDLGPDIAFHVSVTLATAALVFLTDQHLPLSFLPIVPLVWGSFLVSARWLSLEILGVSMIASYASLHNTGPFAFDLLGPALGGALLQFFEISTVVIVLMLALTVFRERESSARLGDSELLYRRNFENSLSGTLIAVREETCWRVRSYNRAAGELLPQLTQGADQLCTLLGRSAAESIAGAAAQQVDAELTVSLEDGRHLQVGLSSLDLGTEEECFAIELLDITDSLRAQQLMQADLDRAQEVQRALSPSPLPPRQGWEHAATAVTAREIGGDFYDLRISGPRAAMALGDVMGKGIGAGLLAAVTRTALRSSSVTTRPAEVLADAARVVEEDLTRTGAFVTLAFATVDLLNGQTRLADAGHGLSFVIRADGAVERVASTDFPIGLGTVWRELHLELAPGDSLLMVSDGVLDAWGTSIEELSDTIAALSPQLLHQRVDEFVATLCDGAGTTGKRIDDATALMLRRERSPK